MEPLYLYIIVSDVITMLTTIIIPPFVGVHVFFICDLGPSSRMLCPNFNRLKKGMNRGDMRTVIKKAIAIVINNIERFTVSPPRITTVHLKKLSFIFYNELCLFLL